MAKNTKARRHLAFLAVIWWRHMGVVDNTAQMSNFYCKVYGFWSWSIVLWNLQFSSHADLNLEKTWNTNYVTIRCKEDFQALLVEGFVVQTEIIFVDAQNESLFLIDVQQ